MRYYADFSLEFLIKRSGISAGVPMRRLNAIENLLMLLTRNWRPDVPIRPREEVRMSGETRDRLLGWINETGDVDNPMIERLAPYRSEALILGDVASGLVRVLLRDADALDRQPPD